VPRDGGAKVPRDGGAEICASNRACRYPR